MQKKAGNKNIRLTIKNIRCFSEEQHFDIRPLTFLVGENSTGKTTVMGCFSVIGNLINSHSRNPFNIPDFNREPYLMGSFQDIVTKKLSTISSKNGQKETFEIGCDLDESNCKYKIHFVEREKGAEPFIQKARVDFKDVIFTCDNKKLTIDIKGKSKNEKGVIQIPFKGPDNRFIYDFIEEPYYLLRHFIHRRNIIENRKDSRKNGKKNTDQKHQQSEIIKNIERMFEDRKYRHEMRNIFRDNIVSLAPIRSKPKRTYDPIREIPDPEGTEIPVTIMKLSNTGTDWERMHKKLIQFGQTSDLFSDITVKKYGKSIGEPFQLQFQVRGFQSNIMDIGYGVSQILPLLVRLFYPQREDFKRNMVVSDRFRNRFILQQPEVHLHHKAQSEFASLLIENIKMNNSFLIETHSDYMIDRARIEIRKKNISHEDVSLIYLEPMEEGVKAYNISFDKEGNLTGTTKGYRDFFIKESNHFLGFED